MCFGAVLQTRIDRVVFGAANPRQGAVGGVMDLRVGPWKRPPTVDGGVLEERCARLLSAFFAARR
jgi:tRNA(Arg) A34 adenosine deaminase TadA